MTTQNGVLVDIAEYANHILSKNLTQTQEVKYFFQRISTKRRRNLFDPSSSAKMLKIRLLRPDFSFWIQGIHPKETKLPR